MSLTPSYQELRRQPRLDLASVVPLAAPMTMHIEPTNVCNMRCSFCPVSLPSYAEESGFHGHMPMELYTKILHDLQTFPKLKALKLYFIGEPFLNPNLVEMTRMAQGLAERTEITTNGSVYAPEIIETGLDYLRVSIYSTKPSKITRNVQAFMERRRALGRTTPHISVKFLALTEADAAAFRKTYEGVADEMIVEGQECYHNWATTGSLELPVIAPPQKQNCPYVHYMMVVKANGEVVPCCADWNARLRLGNVRDQSLQEIWMGCVRRELARAHVAGERAAISACSNCNLLMLTPDNLDHLTLDEYDKRRER